MVAYTEETLIELNPSYHREHVLKAVDVEKANNWVSIIENSRNSETPQIGDMVQFTDKNGNYYARAHIDEINNESLYICERPSIPFVGKTSNGSLYTSAGGGAWSHIPKDLTFVGKEQKYFKDWGHCRTTGNGTVVFSAEVNVWEYAEKDLAYTTKTHDKFYLDIREDVPSNEYKYLVTKDSFSHTAFKKQEEYQAWLKTFGGIELDGYYPNQKIVWTLKQHKKCVPLEEYLTTEGIIDSELCNGSVQECKRVLAGTEITTYLPYQNQMIELNSVRHMNAYKD